VDVLRREISAQLFQEHDRNIAADAAFADPDIEQITIEKPRRGGRRKGAGRKKTGVRRGGPHRKRPELSPKHPVHVTMRMDRRRPELRNHHIYNKVNRVLRGFLGRDDFRVVHVSIQNHHFHLLVEAADRKALSRNMKSLAIRFQRAINGEVGSLFTHRYHAVQIKTARQARRALACSLTS
jgi:REP element-mobilizing transposase RayT